MVKLQPWTKKSLSRVICTIGLLAYSATFAASPEAVVAEVTFVDRTTIAKVNALQYGPLAQNLANLETVVIATNSGTTDAADNIPGGTQVVAKLTVTATPLHAITILVDTVVSGTDSALTTFICKYDVGAYTACDGDGYVVTPVGSAPLLIDATLTGDGLSIPGAADGSFDVTIFYQ